MPVKGDIRSDGRVYVSNGYWQSMSGFIRAWGSDYWEKAAKRIEAKAIVAAKRNLRRCEVSRRKKLWARRRVCPAWAAYRKRERAKVVSRAGKKYYKKQNPGRAKEREVAGLRREFVAVINELNSRLVARRVCRNALIRAADRALCPKRVILTDEQRAARRREDKRNYKHRRRARLRGSATPAQIRKARMSAGGVCFYCGCRPDYLTVDHYVPLARGGRHDIENIVFACHRCNSEKRDLMPSEFCAMRGFNF